MTTEEQMIELKTCPFCGGEAILLHGYFQFTETSYIKCDKCSSQSYEYMANTAYSSDERAIEAWNRRADND